MADKAEGVLMRKIYDRIIFSLVFIIIFFQTTGTVAALVTTRTDATQSDSNSGNGAALQTVQDNPIAGQEQSGGVQTKSLVTASSAVKALSMFKNSEVERNKSAVGATDGSTQAKSFVTPKAIFKTTSAAASEASAGDVPNAITVRSFVTPQAIFKSNAATTTSADSVLTTKTTVVSSGSATAAGKDGAQKSSTAVQQS